MSQNQDARQLLLQLLTHIVENATPKVEDSSGSDTESEDEKAPTAQKGGQDS